MRALVLSGGGSRIHYHVGAASWLMGVCAVKYDLFAGVSTGAIAAAFLAQFPHEENSHSVAELLTLTNSVHSIYKGWPIVGLIAGAWKASFFSSSPLRKILKAHLSEQALRSSGRLLRIGAVDLRSGEIVTFTERSDGLVKAVAGSSAFPGILEPVELGSMLLVDGGVRQQTPLAAAIDAGATIIDVVLTSPVDSKPMAWDGRRGALQVMLRAADLMADQITANDVNIASLTNKLVMAGISKGKVYAIALP